MLVRPGTDDLTWMTKVILGDDEENDRMKRKCEEVPQHLCERNTEASCLLRGTHDSAEGDHKRKEKQEDLCRAIREHHSLWTG